LEYGFGLLHLAKDVDHLSLPTDVGMIDDQSIFKDGVHGGLRGNLAQQSIIVLRKDLNLYFHRHCSFCLDAHRKDLAIAGASASFLRELEILRGPESRKVREFKPDYAEWNESVREYGDTTLVSCP
jgi:hypothetical protein